MFCKWEFAFGAFVSVRSNKIIRNETTLAMRQAMFKWYLILKKKYNNIPLFVRIKNFASLRIFSIILVSYLIFI